MGNGHTPPGIDLDTRGTIDDGTLGLNESPPPGPIGLDAKNGSAKGATASISDRILSYARRKRGDHGPTSPAVKSSFGQTSTRF